MSKIRSVVRFSAQFGIDPVALDAAGALDPTLNVDTAPFIDPLLLEHSRHPEIFEGARRSYEAHFTTSIKLLDASRSKNDTAWRNAMRLLSFPEVKGTCLGYGTGSVVGSGSGPQATIALMETARDIVSLGVPATMRSAAMSASGFSSGPSAVKSARACPARAGSP